ncbi:MAG TPA: peptidylprolyl isomerase [Thermoanaerobaculia bacterium]|nr:peptidylprolyl isomerase [Thermoanaerobaculia bacterium]
MKRFIVAAVAAVALAAAAGAQTAPDANVVATVNGEKITRAEFDAAWNALSPDVQANYERSGGRITYLETYIRRKLIVQEAIKNNLTDQADVAAQLRRAREEVLFDAYVRKQITTKIVTDAEVQAYYEKNKKEFEKPERVKARHIIATPSEQQVVNTSGDNAIGDEHALEKIKALAQQLRIAGVGDQVVTPQQFADLAVKFSEDGSAPTGGDLGWFERGRMVPEFEQAAFELAPGETSGVVKTQFGYHVIFVEARKPAGAEPFADVAEKIRQKLLTDRADQVMSAMNQLSSDLRRDSAVTISRENF